MLRPSERKPKIPKVHLQGDNRPFGLPMKPHARVLYADVQKHIDPLGLDLEKQMLLLRGTRAILAEYLGVLRAEEDRAKHAASLHAIERIAIESAKLAKHLGRLQNKYLAEIMNGRVDPEAEHDPPHFDFPDLIPTLEFLSGAAQRARSKFQTNPRSPPKKTSLDNAITRFRSLLGKVGLEIDAVESGSPKGQRKSLTGPGGAFLLAVFQEFDRHTIEANLCGAWDRTRTNAAQPENQPD